MNIWKERVESIVFPRRCPVCGEIVTPRGELICPGCIGRLSVIRDPVCCRCGKRVESDRIEYCFDCSRHTHSFIQNMALLEYNEAAKDSMAAVKYKNRREYLDFYGRAICLRFGKRILKLRPQGLVPVPVHKTRKKIRGFNQAELLADIIGEELSIPVYPDALKRIRNTLPQKELGPKDRLKNLTSAFEPGELPANVKTVIIVDDIYTTGSTIEACARALKSAGAEEVYSVTVCIGKMA